MRAYRFLPLLLLLSGCAHYEWIKPNGDPSTMAADNYACQQESFASAPPVYTTYVPMPRPPEPPDIRTICSGPPHHQHCTTIVDERPPYVPPSYLVDRNEGPRKELFNACMQARGWLWARIEDPN